MVIFASEDIGNADPQALLVAVAGMQAVEFVGLPECQLTLSQVVTYLALAPKSRSATDAILAARKDIREGRLVPVPRHLRDAHYQGAQRLGHGTGYRNPAHDPDAANQTYGDIPRTYYHPPPEQLRYHAQGTPQDKQDG
jgi:putative ATPase